MSTAQEDKKHNFKLAQYFNLYQDDQLLNKAEQLFNEEFNINHQFSDAKESKFTGFTALDYAVKNWHMSVMKFLLSRGANPTIKNQKGFTPLYMAINGYCEHSNYRSYYDVEKECCELLLSAQITSGNGANPTDGNGLSHFHIACMRNCAEAVEFFLRNGISVDEPVSVSSSMFPGYTPLHLAARFSSLQAIKVLLKYGAKTHLKDAEGMTFMCRLLQDRVEIIQPPPMLRKTSYEVALAEASLTSMNFLLQNNSYPINYGNLTHFHMACSSTDIPIAEKLLTNTADINQALDMNSPLWPGYTPLHFAAYSSIEMVKMLVKNGANILAKNAKGMRPLDICIDRYEVEAFHAALSLDANWTSILLSDRKTRLLSLVFAMKDTKQFYQFIESRPQLVNTIVPIDSPVWQGYTPLHLAVTFYEDYATIYQKDKRKDDRAEHIIDQLMTKGANINAQEVRGMTPLHLAYRYKHPVVDQALLKYRDHLVNVVDGENLSHLHIACRNKDTRTIEKILQTCENVDWFFNGQSETSCITAGSTPLHCVFPKDEIIGLLLERGADHYPKDANDIMAALHHSKDDSYALLFPVKLRDAVVPDTGLSHLHIAVRYAHLNAVETLLDNGADVNQAVLRDSVLTMYSGSNFKYKAGNTPLDLAIFRRDKVIMKTLLRRGAEMLVKEPFVVERGDSLILRPLISTLNRDDSVFALLEEEIGLTMLHVACSRRDVDLIKALLVGGADANARIDVRSRLWPGYTPLHVVVEDPDHENNLDEIIRLLLDNGADVSLTTCDGGETPLYLAYQSVPRDLGSNRYSCMKLLLRAHQNFTVNPIKPNCLSYFHLACTIGDVDTVSKFLQHGGADVNEPTDFFKRTDSKTVRDTAGATALLLAATSSEHAMDPMSQLQMVDFLLNNGADVDARDVHGNTALHLVAQWNHRRRDVMLRLIRSKANANGKNIDDETPLEILLTASKNVPRMNLMWNINVDATVEDVKFFLELGCCFNVFNRGTEKGLIAITLSFMPFDNLLYLIKSSMINFPQLVQTDEKSRTVMHNVVSNINGFIANEPLPSKENYITMIEELGNFGLDVDGQDALGRSPLHIAVLFRNVEAISGLLKTGADVNVVDASGRTAFSYLFDTCVRCLEKEKFLVPITHVPYDHLNVFSTFMIHMKKLLLCGLDVNLTNQNLMLKSVEKCNSESMSVPQDFEIQINELRGLNIPQSRLKLGSFLSETDAIHAYASLPETDRNAVDAFFKYEMNDLRIRYSHVASILLLQYRKAMKRVEMNQSAEFALGILARMHLPVLCSDAIFKLLSNSELLSMTDAVA